MILSVKCQKTEKNVRQKRESSHCKSRKQTSWLFFSLINESTRMKSLFEQVPAVSCGDGCVSTLSWSLLGSCWSSYRCERLISLSRNGADLQRGRAQRLPAGSTTTKTNNRLLWNTNTHSNCSFTFIKIYWRSQTHVWPPPQSWAVRSRTN